jgi:MFS family permease
MLHARPPLANPPSSTPSSSRNALIAAWLGWACDGLDGYLYIMVALRFVRELMGPEATAADVSEKAALIQAVFLVGWAVGGAVFGRIGDRLGRTRTLTLTVLTYAIFTGMAFFATQWWHLLIFRFVAALGIGGEWAAGSALVSETLHSKHKAWASAALQSGYMVGCIAAALTAGVMADFPPRYVFLVGLAPALLTLWIRWAVPEPAEWKAAVHGTKPPPISTLFAPGLRHITLLTIGLTGVALTTVWTFLYFGPQAIRAIPEVSTWSEPEKQRFVTQITVMYMCVNIVGNFFATYLARWIGARAAFASLFAASLAVFAYFFHQPLTFTNVPWAMGLAAFFALGLFGIFPLYIPPLFPTLVRTLGAGFTYNVGRIISAVGAYFGGLLVTQAGGPHRVIFFTALLFVPGIIIAMCVPRDRDEVRA